MILVVTLKQVLVFDAAGRRLQALQSRVGARAVAQVGPWLALGNQDGHIELVPGPSGRTPPSLNFEGVPSSAVVRLMEGPTRTLVAGFANGTVGIWSTVNGAKLETRRLHGPVRFIARKGNRLHVATELGDHAAMDLGVYLRDYCELLREVWAQAPASWEGGRAQLRAPPGQHACAR